ncbi:MAG: electron transport complex subunit E [Oligoflexia bacterium]|nr:electron transport complex subunit E [Oligoflexia bacterium]
MSQSDRTAEELLKGLWKENPTFVQVLGMCPALAVTNSAVNAIVMGLATLFVLVASSGLVSMLRHFIPKQVRISTYIVIIATFVSVADLVLQATLPVVHKELGAFIPLIVVNCLILGRQEAFAAKNTVKLAIADAIGMGLGFTFALTLLGVVREILGSGSLFGMALFGPNYEPWVVMILPPGGFIMLGLILLVFSWVKQRRQARQARQADPAPKVGVA